MRQQTLARQIVVRLDDDLYVKLEHDAEENGRTMAQTVRHLLRQSFAHPKETKK